MLHGTAVDSVHSVIASFLMLVACCSDKGRADDELSSKRAPPQVRGDATAGVRTTDRSIDRPVIIVLRRDAIASLNYGEFARRASDIGSQSLISHYHADNDRV